MPSEEEIAKIIALHEDGNSQREIAKAFDKSVGWVNAVFKKLNIQSERSQTKNATNAKQTYDRARRLKLNDLWFEKIEAMLEGAKDPNSLRALAIPYGVAEDKRAKLDPDNPSGKETGLEEMRKAIHTARRPDDMEASSS